MSVGELMLMQQIRDDVVDQRCRSKCRLGFDAGVQCDGACVCIVRSRQTAESFAGAATSATAAATFLQLLRLLKN